MNKTIGILVFALVTGASYFVFSTADLELFPCKITHTEDHGLGPERRTESGYCSPYRERTGLIDTEFELTPAGWALTWASCLGLGLGAGAIAGGATRKR